MGLVMIFNTSAAEVLDHHLTQSTHHALIRQLMYAFVGLVTGSIAISVGYLNLLKHSGKLFLIGTLLLAMVLIPGIGVTANGARRWIGIAGLTFQPSEFVRQIIPLYFIHRILHLVPNNTNKISSRRFFQVIGTVLLPVILIVLEPNNGTVAIICVTVTAVIFLMRIPAKYWAVPMAGVLLVA